MNDGFQQVARVNRESEPQLTWMINEEETHIIHFNFPLHIQISLTDVPLYRCIIYFNTEELVEVSFRTNPAEPINVQHKLACLCIEETISNICDAYGWQQATHEFYQHCGQHSIPEKHAIMKFELAKMHLFGQIHLWSDNADNIDSDDDI